VTSASAAPHAAQQNRNTIFVEDAILIDSVEWPDDQFVMRMTAHKCAAAAEAGSFVHLQCDESIPMRRPLSIMRADRKEGWIEVLYKIVGQGLRALSAAKVGDTISLIGPIGKGFIAHKELSNRVLIGGGVGIPPMVFLTEQLLAANPGEKPLVLMGSEIPFPFDIARSAVSTDWLAQDTDGAMPLVESWSVCSRLATLAGFDGCFDGYVTDLAKAYIDSLPADELRKVEIFSCGPTPMLKAVASLAADYNVACQVSLEEFMACAVGGCAGCAVEVQTADGPAMKRVCVDGPVFSANEVFPL
jgi:dihydroorotate dehydrogenase electron transfer subunit